MRHILMTLFAALLMLAPATKTTAQATNHSTLAARSEQFILDSLQADIERARIDTQYKMHRDSLNIVQIGEQAKFETYEEVVQLSIPLIFFGTIILIVWLSLNASYRKKKEQYRILEIAIERGRELPENFFDEPAKRKQSWLNTLRNGATTLGCGIGIALLGYITEEEIITGIAFIPAFIGLGYLLVAWLQYREEKRHAKQEPATPECIESIEENNAE